MDFSTLLDGLEGEDRAARERLLERLADEGYTLEEMEAAIEEDRLALLLVERVLGGRYTAKELAKESGLPAAQMLRIRRLLGLPEPGPDEPVFGDEEVDAAKAISMFLSSGLGEESIAEITRVLGEGMSRLAATTAAAFVDAFLEPGDSEDEVAERFAVLAEQLIPAIDPVLRAAYRQHLAESVRRGMLSSAERESGEVAGDQEITVCFVDMVGFTRLGAQIEAQELGSLASKLAELATDVTAAPGATGQDDRRRGNVRVVRYRGGGVGRAVAARGRPGGRVAELPGRRRVRIGPPAGRRLLRPRRQPGEPSHRRGSSRQRPVYAGGPRRGTRPVRLVVRAQSQAQGHVRGGLAVPRPAPDHAASSPTRAPRA